MAQTQSEYIRETAIPGLFKLDRPVLHDNRGFFREVLRMDDVESIMGERFNLAQWNHSLSYPGVIRALHAENWNKLVYPITGEAFVAIVDIRPDSPAFGKIEQFTFNDQNRHALFIPKGLANSICVIGSEAVNYIYLVDKLYDGSDTTAVAWDDPDLQIDWPIKDPIISERDRNNPRLRELYPERF